MNSLSVTISFKNERRNKDIVSGGKTKRICASKSTSMTKGRKKRENSLELLKKGKSEQVKWLIEAKIITLSDVVCNVYRGNTQNH